MFRSATIFRELVQSLVKVIFLLKHSVKLRRCILCGDMAASAAISSHNMQRRNFTECFNRNITLARLCTSSLRMVEDRNM